MSAVRRRGFNLLTGVSLLLCITAVEMGVRSYWFPDQWNFAPRPAPPVQGVAGTWHHTSYLASTGGRLMLLDAAAKDSDPRGPGPRMLPPGYQHWISFDYPRPLPFGPVQGERHWSVPGVRYFFRPAQLIPRWPPVPEPAGPPGQLVGDITVSGWRHADVSWWLPAVTGTVLPAYWVWRRARQQRAIRKAKGLCLRCGYDLRASSGRCPECGATAATATPA
jgi:hypothetical protein